MKRKILLSGIIVAATMFLAFQLSAHCQIPCGIFDDETQFTLMFQDVATIEKSMNQINTLSKDKEPNYNQLVRWIDNKEEHAGKLSDSITYYFMAQRVKPVTDPNSKDYSKYIRELALLHQMLVISMKTKQSTDTALCSQLRDLIDDFKKLYLS